ncbi:MAG: glucuronate isomerase [Defluviitaleaceae bacterium]|nr:glucuronate isomerase [Defluviitaleaceae bacterium]
MKPFMDEKFLLHSDTALKLYEYCKDLPIIDYHCHLEPSEIAKNKRFKNITDLALGGDHYKWRLMRACGVDEKYITGDASDGEKFFHWCATVEDCIGNPLYHWTHLEMRRYFDYDGPINGKLAGEIFNHCNKIIGMEDFSAWGILRRFRVEQIGTTDDPADSLDYHIQMAAYRKSDPSLPLVSPTWRPSKIMNIEAPGFIDYAKTLEINNWDDLFTVLTQRLDFFHENGCRASDHSLEPPVYENYTESEVAIIFKKALAGESLSLSEINKYKTYIMVWLGREYNKRGWVMQLHMGAQRSNNTRMVTKLGPDTGYDSMSDESYSRPLARILDALDMKDALPKTILYGLNPVSDMMLATMIGNFQGGGVRGKIQWGCPWWFNDTKPGIENHLTALASAGVLSRFIGMLTDSRSFMSYPRHEYFRRIVANSVAQWVEMGEFPDDHIKLRQIIEGIGYRNAREYFQL